MTVLLDANVLIALALVDHVHHDPVETWFTDRRGKYATCPITRAALLRLVLRNGASIADGRAVLAGITGHRQVTDAYLAASARHKRGRIATLDGGMAELHPDVADLIEA